MPRVEQKSKKWMDFKALKPAGSS